MPNDVHENLRKMEARLLSQMAITFDWFGMLHTCTDPIAAKGIAQALAQSFRVAEQILDEIMTEKLNALPR